MSGSRHRVRVVDSDTLASTTGARSGGAGGDNSGSSSVVDSQLALLESTKATERVRGIQQLADILAEDTRSGRSTSIVQSLSEATWEHIISWTARIMIKESQSFVNKYGEEWPEISASGSRLSSRIQTQYSSHVRHIWVAAMPFLSARLARFLVKHITEALANDPCLSHVVGLDYAKTLRAWASHSPHLMNCKDSRAEAVAAVCIQYLSRFNAVPESQASTESSANQTILPGDVECAATLLAVVKAANPSRMAQLGDRVLDFCAEFCGFYARENACHSIVLDTINAILLELAEEQMLANFARTKSILSCCLRLWSTRSIHVKHSVLHSIRIITRIVSSHMLSERGGDREALELLELALKHMTAGSWDKFRFMSLPRSLLSLWPLVRGSNSTSTSTSSQGYNTCSGILDLGEFLLLQSIIDPFQMAFFDTVTFLVVNLLNVDSQREDTASTHRRKRARRNAPTSLSRLLATMESQDAADKARGSAQVIWYVLNFYPDQAPLLECFNSVVSLLSHGSTSEHGELAEWALGILHTLLAASTGNWESSAHFPLDATAKARVWQHAVAAVEAGLSGSANLAFALLNSTDPVGSNDDVHALCRRAAGALLRCTKKSDPDFVRLSLLLAQYMSAAGKPSADAASVPGVAAQAVATLCQRAASRQWPLSLFSTIVSHVLGFANQEGVLNGASGAPVPGPHWDFELRFARVLQMLDAFSVDPRACQRLVDRSIGSHAEKRNGSVSGSSTISTDSPVLSQLSITQWYSTSKLLLGWIKGQVESKHTQNGSQDEDHDSWQAVPFVCHTLWQIAAHMRFADASSDDTISEADQLTKAFSRQLDALVADSQSPGLVCQTLSFICGWSESYTPLGGLVDIMHSLISMLFNAEEHGFVYELAMGGLGQSPPSLSYSENSYRESSAQGAIETNQRSLDWRGKVGYRQVLESQMLSSAHGIHPEPWKPFFKVLATAAHAHNELRLYLSNKLADLIDCLDDAHFLPACDFIAQCVLLSSEPADSALQTSLKQRALSLLDSYSHSGHMPTLYCVFRVVSALIHTITPDEEAADEDLPRFVAWLISESKKNRVDPCIEIDLIRTMIGPWGCQEESCLARSLVANGLSATHVLAHLTQTSSSFAVRLVAEEQLAMCQLASPHLLPNGGFGYLVGENPAANDTLVLMTRYIGLAVLIARSKTAVPGAIAILLNQISPKADCSPEAARLCQGLLSCIALLSGFDGIRQMVAECRPDILNSDVGVVSLGIESALAGGGSPADLSAYHTDVALEWMLQGDISKATDALSEVDPQHKDASAIKLLSHALVQQTDDNDRYALIREELLVPCLTTARLEDMIAEKPEELILQLLALYRPEPVLAAEIDTSISAPIDGDKPTNILLAYSRLNAAQLSAKLVQWGRRYGRVSIQQTMEYIAQTSAGTALDEFLSGPRVAWVVLHMQSQLQSAHFDSERQRILCALGFFLSVTASDVVNSPLVQAVLTRMLVDCWLCSDGSTGAIACYIIALLLDRRSAPASPINEMVSSVCVGMLDKLIGKFTGKAATDAKLPLQSLACLLKAVLEIHGDRAGFDSCQIFIGSELEDLLDWSTLSPLVRTKEAIRGLDDRMGLAAVADQAAPLLYLEYYSATCAEFLLEAAERLMRLALRLTPQDDVATPPSMNPKDAPVQVDLAVGVINVLSRVRGIVVRHVCKLSSKGYAKSRVTTTLLRVISLLSALEKPVGDKSSSIVDQGAESEVNSMHWLICDVVSKSQSQQAVMAAINVAISAHKSPQTPDAHSLEELDDKQKQILQDVSLMPPVHVYAQSSPALTCFTVQDHEPQALNDDLLADVCPPNLPAGEAFSRVVCALATWLKPTSSLRHAMPLIFADSRVASCLMPRILCEVLCMAQTETCAEISAFILDFAYNWRHQAPEMARDVIARALQARQLDSQFTDIREFFSVLPLALFETAALAAELGMPETAALLLEYDLFCAGGVQPAGVSDISKDAKELLQSVYQKLGNQPAAQLLGSVSSIGDVLRRCHDTSNWQTLLLYQEAVPDAGRPQVLGAENELDIGDTLVSLGLLNAVLPGSAWSDHQSTGTGASQAMFAASWRLARWDVPAMPLAQPSAPSVFLVPEQKPEESLYSIFKLRSLGQLSAASVAVQEYMVSSDAVSALAISSDHLREAWPCQAIALLLPLITSDTRDTPGSARFVDVSQISEFMLSQACGHMQAESLEPVHLANLTLHEIAVREVIAKKRQPMLSEVFGRYKEAVRSACAVSRLARNWQNSMNHIFRLRSMSQAAGIKDGNLEPELKLWEAETLWDSGNRTLAIEMLQSHKNEMERQLQSATAQMKDRSGHAASLAETAEMEARTILVSRIILTVGEWSDKQRKERPAVLWEEYFNKSAQLLQGSRTPTTWTGRALHALAEFSERQCEELTSTRDNEATAGVRRQKTKELEACQQEIARATNGSEANRLKGILRRLEIQVTNDQKELAELRSSIGGFLRLAIWSFVRCLECSNTFDNSVYSLVSLIMTHAHAPELASVLSSDLMDGVASHKFLPLVHQLCARLSTEDDAFHQTVTRLVSRMAVDYPYHTMYHLFALRNANRTSPSASSRSGGRRSGLDALQIPESERMEQRRSDAATKILVDVSGQNSDLKSIVQVVDELCNVYIELAVHPVPEKFKSGKLEGRLIAFGSRLRIARLIKNLPPNIPVLTAMPQADAPRDYMCVPFISSLSEGYSLAGGINLPKIVRVLGTNGRRYKQLVKGKDDMRQDAIIEQLFRVINRFMSATRGGSSGGSSSSGGGGGASPTAGLSIRTYQVVPMTKRCGVLQWVDNTMPFGSWFRDRETRYRGHAPTANQLRSIVHNVHKEKTVTAQQKLDVFDRVCALAPPVFRFFFYEQFYNAQSWFEHREIYIRSAAVSSIAGWVLGIGDRHMQNILVDLTTAELVHIDLGIAFDLGKLLPIPELVPFRLTREMVDGMGILGRDGTFRHFCEVALRAMRENARVVITILNVLKVDPLYMWSLIPLRLDKIDRSASLYIDGLGEGGSRAGAPPGGDSSRQGMLLDGATAAAAAEENKEAERSILHVGQRLGASISVEGQVNELIQQATDRRYLSRMFEGWCAWC